jgi:gas vesicle protein GvpK
VTRKRPQLARTRRRRSAAAKPASARRRRAAKAVALDVQELDALRHEVERQGARLTAPRWNVDPDDAQRSLAQLVLTLVEFLRKLMERQAVRRMDAGTLTAAEIESIGRALMRLEETIVEMARRFGLRPEDLNLQLGPLGRLM